MSFLLPLILAGSALAIGPILIHRIRRPEREPVRFSSLMFIPDVKREVIERRRMQHILLMLLRMAILIALALAFARPFQESDPVLAVVDGEERHIILVDTSLSTGTGDRFDAIADAAHAILSDLPASSEVALIAFGGHASTLVRFDEPDAGRAAQDAVRNLKPTYDGTDYGAALRAAQDLMLSLPAKEETRLAVHLISDFQRSGMPDSFEPWKMTSSIELIPVPVEVGDARNVAVSDVAARRRASNELQIVGKVKNWSERDNDSVRVSLVIDGKTVDTIEKPVRAGNATQVRFVVDAPAGRAVQGHLQLASDDLNADNARYFSWSPPPKHPVYLVTSTDLNSVDLRSDPAGWPSAWFVAKGLPSGAEWPFDLHVLTPSELDARLATDAPPSAIVLSEVDVLSSQLDAYVSDGGAVLSLIEGYSSADENLLSMAGLSPEPSAPEQPVARMGWVDFGHPVFAAFGDEKYNDFSHLRFSQDTIFGLVEPTTAHTMARFDSGGVAMTEESIDDGRMITWLFGLGLGETNMPKSPQFVPLLYETLRYLCRVEESVPALRVGDTFARDELRVSAEAALTYTIGDSEARALDGNGVRLDRPGDLQVRDGESDAILARLPVNVHPDESDPARIDPAELQLKLASGGGASRARLEAGIAEPAKLRTEYGYYLIVVFAALFVLENIYMAYLTRQGRRAASVVATAGE